MLRSSMQIKAAQTQHSAASTNSESKVNVHVNVCVSQ